MKKKVNDILKGVAGAGIALGGAAAFGELDVIYAYDSEQVDSEEQVEYYQDEELAQEERDLINGQNQSEQQEESAIDYASQSNSAKESTTVSVFVPSIMVGIG